MAAVQRYGDYEVLQILRMYGIDTDTLSMERARDLLTEFRGDTLQVRLTADEAKALNNKARIEGVSKEEMIRVFVLRGLGVRDGRQ